MKRQLTVAVAGAAILAAGISGCSSNKSGGVSSLGAGRLRARPAATTRRKVIIDGKDQNVQGTTICTKAGGSIVALRSVGNQTGISVVLADANPLAVKAVQLGNVNGVTLQLRAKVRPGQRLGDQGRQYVQGHRHRERRRHGKPDAGTRNKPFEIDATCSADALADLEVDAGGCHPLAGNRTGRSDATG